MRWIVNTSLRLRYCVVFGALVLLVAGAARLREMPVDVFPEFAPPRVEVQTACLGLTAAEVEELITVPLEQTLTGIAGLDVMRSKSVSQLSSIELVFRPGTDLLAARQLVQERIAIVTPTLPTWATPPVMIQPLSATSRALKIGVSSRTLSPIELSNLARWKIRQRLLRVDGVANVAIWGFRKDQAQALVDPERLAAADVSLDSVMEAAADATSTGLLRYSPGAVIGTGGFLETASQRLAIRHVLPIFEARDLAAVPVPTRSGGFVRLGDVASVVQGSQPLVGDAVVNDGVGLLLVVEKLPWANTLAVTRGVERALELLRPALPGVELDSTIFRPATFIETAVDNLARALLIGSLLVVLVLALFLLEWRTALISLASIPLSLVAAGLVLYLRGETINTMVLAGLVISVGVVVDDAIIGAENVWRRLRQHRAEGGDGRSTASVILEASLEVRSPIVYATLIILVAVVPVFFMGGLSGAFFEPLALSYSLAVLASMVVALTVTPAMSLMLLPGAPLERRESPVKLLLQRSYGAALAPVVRRPRRAFVAAAVVMAAGAAALPALGQSFLPSFKERDFLMHWVTKPGSSLVEERRITIQASRELRAIPGVRNFGAHIGQAQNADEVVGVDFGENWISIDPKADYDRTLAAIQEVVAGYPGIYRDVLTYLKERIREVLTGTGEAAIVVRIFGDDLGVLRATAERARNELARVDGLVDLKVELQEDVPQIDVEVDVAVARRYGLKPGDVRRAAATIVNGTEVADFYWRGRTWDVNVWGTPSTRSSLTKIRELRLDTPAGTQVRLADVATVRVRPTPNVIKREAASRRIDLVANASGRDLGSVAADVKRTLQAMPFPRQYHAEVLGEYAERQAAQRRVLAFALAAAAAILLLLVGALGSLRLALLAYATLPLALVGGVLAAFAGDGVISLGSLVGFLTVFGIAARNGILLISHFRHLEREEGEAFGPELVLRGARERLTPILMTAGATALALVPLALAGNAPGQEIEHPMAIVILGGLVTSTLLNLFLVPALYLRFGRRAPATPAAGRSAG